MATNPICPDCTEVNIEECDDELCRIEVPAKCVIYDADLTCLNLEAGATLAEILAMICTLTGTNLAVETTASIDCPNGGTTISIGIDTAGDGSIGTLLVTFDVCDGADGTNGTSQTVAVVPIPPNVNCLYGGIQITVDGTDYFVCNGANGSDGTNCDCPEAPEVDYSCLEALGVVIGDNPMQAMVNVLCDLISQVGGVELRVADQIYNIIVGETLAINLLTGATIPPGDSVTAVTIVGLQTGAVNYNGEATNVSPDGILSITGVSAGTDTRTFSADTDAPATSNSANLIINVTDPVETSFWGGVDPVCFSRRGQNEGFSWELPINPAATSITGTIRVSTTGGSCAAPSGCADTDSLDIILAVFGTGSVLFSSGNYNITLDGGSDAFAGGFDINFPYATVSCASCSVPKVWLGDPVTVTLNLTITTPTGNASFAGSYVIPQMVYPDDYPHVVQEECFINPGLA